MSKQLAASETPSTREAVLQLALSALQADEDLRDIFKELGISELKIHSKLQAILAKTPTIAIPIDGMPNDLQEWVRTLRTTVKIWILEKYVSASNPDHVLYSLPDESSPTVTTKIVSGKSISTINNSNSLTFVELINEQLLAEGEELIIEYKPKGSPKRTFSGFVRKDGIEVDGKVYSPSYAALYCLHKINATLKSRNGWQTWKTKQGVLISVLRDKLQNPVVEIE